MAGGLTAVKINAALQAQGLDPVVVTSLPVVVVTAAQGSTATMFAMHSSAVCDSRAVQLGLVVASVVVFRVLWTEEV